ncbi:MAG: 50S ribosomal protein L27 [Anaerolineae bacterium]|jgi:large subunit ribosomal protein L27
MAHKKGSGSTSNKQDSIGKRRGIKRYDGQRINAGTIIVRQVGNLIHAGENVGCGRDYTLFATIDGYVKFEPHIGGRKQVSVYAERQ